MTQGYVHPSLTGHIGYAFGIITINGVQVIEAEYLTDTLNFVGVGIGITGDQDTKTLTFTNLGGGNSSGTYLISGGGVTWLQDYDFAVASAVYVIDGTQYSSNASNVTLSPSDPTNDRIDIIAVNSDGLVEVIEGVPSATPEAPDVDPETQLQLTFILVAAASTQPNVNTTDIYQNNAEWTYSDNTANFNPDDIGSPYLGSKAIKGTNVTNTNWFMLEAPSSINIQNWDNLTFWLRTDGGPWVNKAVRVQWFLNGTAVGGTVLLTGNNLGYQSSQAGYQPVVIPTSYFNTNGNLVNRVRFTVTRAGAPINVFFDNIQLQAGVAPPVDSVEYMYFRGDWDNSASYIPQEVVLHEGNTYVALITNSNSEPQPDDSNPNWRLLTAGVVDGDKGDITVTSNGDVWTIDNNSVTYAKMQNVSAPSVLLGRGDSGSGNVQQITLGTGLSMSGTTLNGAATTKYRKVFRPRDNEAPAANYATLDTRNLHPVLDFDTTTQEAAVFGDVIAATYGGGNLSVTVIWGATSATSGTVGWDVTFERVGTAHDIDSDGWATAQTITAVTVPAAAGTLSASSVTVTAGAAGTDSLAAGEAYRLRVRRDVANDNAAGDAELWGVIVTEV